LKNRSFDDKHGRHKFTKDERIELLNKLNICNQCKKDLSEVKINIGDIKPLGSGDSN
jgi:hypothetical protein